MTTGTEWVRCRTCGLLVLRTLARRRRWWHVRPTCRACCLVQFDEPFWGPRNGSVAVVDDAS